MTTEVGDLRSRPERAVVSLSREKAETFAIIFTQELNTLIKVDQIQLSFEPFIIAGSNGFSIEINLTPGHERFSQYLVKQDENQLFSLFPRFSFSSEELQVQNKNFLVKIGNQIYNLEIFMDNLRADQNVDIQLQNIFDKILELLRTKLDSPEDDKEEITSLHSLWGNGSIPPPEEL